MSAIRSSNPDYKAVTIIKVNWDDFSGAPITEELNVRRRSTLVMFNEGKEVGRVIAQTDRSSIQALFDAVV